MGSCSKCINILHYERERENEREGGERETIASKNRSKLVCFNVKPKNLTVFQMHISFKKTK
jgi:hypothetical protein